VQLRVNPRVKGARQKCTPPAGTAEAEPHVGSQAPDMHIKGCEENHSNTTARHPVVKPPAAAGLPERLVFIYDQILYI